MKWPARIPTLGAFLMSFAMPWYAWRAERRYANDN